MKYLLGFAAFIAIAWVISDKEELARLRARHSATKWALSIAWVGLVFTVLLGT